VNVRHISISAVKNKLLILKQIPSVVKVLVLTRYICSHNRSETCMCTVAGVYFNIVNYLRHCEHKSLYRAGNVCSVDLVVREFPSPGEDSEILSFTIVV
jgi:hypothetical protein